jgi:ubiquinone biosynthesis accessory factor UbiJ
MMAGTADVVIERLLDRAVARAITDSPRATELIKRLQGRRLAITVSGTPWTTIIESTGRALKALRPGDAAGRAAAGSPADGPADAPADATIIGAPLSLLALAGSDAQAVIQRGDVQISGNAEIAQQFRELGALLKPDIEAGLARFLGGSGAHLAMRGMRAAAGWTRDAAWTSVRNLAEYLSHESGDLVSRPEAEHFLRGVDTVREQLDRIEARLQLMEQRSATLKMPP